VYTIPPLWRIYDGMIVIYYLKVNILGRYIYGTLIASKDINMIKILTENGGAL
jgi:hypothetical protein